MKESVSIYYTEDELQKANVRARVRIRIMHDIVYSSIIFQINFNDAVGLRPRDMYLL